MTSSDELIVWLSSGMLSSEDYYIDKLTLEKVLDGARSQSLAQTLSRASTSQTRAGAMGLEIAGSIILPIVISAARLFWEAYEKRLMQKLGEEAADLTLDKVKDWFAAAPKPELDSASKELTASIKRIAAERALTEEEIAPLLEAVSQEKLKDLLTRPA